MRRALSSMMARAWGWEGQSNWPKKRLSERSARSPSDIWLRKTWLAVITRSIP